MDFLGQLGSWIMAPLYFLTSFILTSFHRLFTELFGRSDAAQGWAWALSIIGLTVVIRILLIPLFVKQIKSSRNMQMLQPKVAALRKKYGHDKERLAEETMKLYRESGTNPFASCLPLLLQMPIFLALFRLVDRASREGFTGEQFLSQANGESLQSATLFGARIAERFTDFGSVETQVVAMLLVIVMTATTFLTQRQLMSKNMPPEALKGPYAQQQKLLLYVLPVVFAVGGIAFPIGVLLYWTTSNFWTMGQQFYVIRNNPAPGTPAYAAREQRLARRAAKAARAAGGDSPEPATEGGTAVAVDPAPRPPVRNQPKRRSRSKRKPARRS